MSEIKTNIPRVPYSEKENEPLYFLRDRAIAYENGRIPYSGFMFTKNLVSCAPGAFFKINSNEYKTMTDAINTICNAVKTIHSQRESTTSEMEK